MTCAYQESLAELKPFVDQCVQVRFGRGRMFSPCLRGAFAKAYEFAELACLLENEDSAFFIAPSLRGITEDLIVLRALSKLSHAEREQVVTALMMLEVQDKLDKQSKFFEFARPFQPVLRPGKETRSSLKADIRSVWQNNGWPNLTRKAYMPPTIELAQKAEPGVLEVLYDFIYRLTSGFVHFNPQVIYRSGWGSKSATTFSTKNMSAYYLACSRIYGGYLLCLYFEFFRRYLHPGEAELRLVREIREALTMESRWPEMVTFEEMNMEVPKGRVLPDTLIKVIKSIEANDGFIRKDRLPTEPSSEE